MTGIALVDGAIVILGGIALVISLLVAIIVGLIVLGIIAIICAGFAAGAWMLIENWWHGLGNNKRREDGVKRAVMGANNG